MNGSVAANAVGKGQQKSLAPHDEGWPGVSRVAHHRCICLSGHPRPPRVICRKVPTEKVTISGSVVDPGPEKGRQHALASGTISPHLPVGLPGPLPALNGSSSAILSTSASPSGSCSIGGQTIRPFLTQSSTQSLSTIR